jgi:myo-inositol-1(or 4)-monophosphatase
MAPEALSSPNNSIYEEFMKSEMMAVAVNAALAAKDFLSAQNEVIVNSQTGHDIKLQADQEAEKIIVGVLQQTGIPVLSEEAGWIGSNQETDLRWIVDPLDGSLNYARNIPLYCISIALWDGDKPLLGVVYDYVHNSLCKGIVGDGAFLNEVSINVSSVTERSQAVMATGFPVYASFETENLLPFIKDLQSYKKVRLFGSAAFSMMMVAQGSIEVYQENNIAWWDVAAGIALVLAAGGYVDFDFTNKEKHLMRVFASNHIKQKES